MKPQLAAPTNGSSPAAVERDGRTWEFDGSPATRRRQASVIDTLIGVISALRSGAAASRRLTTHTGANR